VQQAALRCLRECSFRCAAAAGAMIDRTAARTSDDRDCLTFVCDKVAIPAAPMIDSPVAVEPGAAAAAASSAAAAADWTPESETAALLASSIIEACLLDPHEHVTVEFTADQALRAWALGPGRAFCDRIESDPSWWRFKSGGLFRLVAALVRAGAVRPGAIPGLEVLDWSLEGAATAHNDRVPELDLVGHAVGSGRAAVAAIARQVPHAAQASWEPTLSPQTAPRQWPGRVQVGGIAEQTAPARAEAARLARCVSSDTWPLWLSPGGDCLSTRIPALLGVALELEDPFHSAEAMAVLSDLAWKRRDAQVELGELTGFWTAFSQGCERIGPDAPGRAIEACAQLETGAWRDYNASQFIAPADTAEASAREPSALMLHPRDVEPEAPQRKPGAEDWATSDLSCRWLYCALG
jgi:hypothetical protein